MEEIRKENNEEVMSGKRKFEENVFALGSVLVFCLPEGKESVEVVFVLEREDGDCVSDCDVTECVLVRVFD